MFVELTFLAAAFMAPPATLMPRTLTMRSAVMKADDVDEDNKPQVHLEPVGSIVEFDDGKHDRAILGVVAAAEAKAKAEVALEIMKKATQNALGIEVSLSPPLQHYELHPSLRAPVFPVLAAILWLPTIRF